MNQPQQPIPWVRLAAGMIGAIVGAVVGGWIYNWGIRQGLDAPMIPGTAIGFGVLSAAKVGRLELGILSAVVALVAGLYLEWSNFPFVADDGLGYFLSHLHSLQPLKILMIAASVFIAFFIGRGREHTHLERPTH